MTVRYYAPHLSDAELCELEGAEFHHLSHVMRAGVGDRIVVFDGSGTSADAEIVELTRSRATLRIVSRQTEPPGRVPNVVLATAVPKADRFRWLVEKATELGVSRLIPLQTARSINEPGATKLDKMRAAVIEACKQSGRNRLMVIDPLTDWQSFLSTAAGAGRLVVADPGGSARASLCDVKASDRGLVLVVGPEGGLTDVEVIQAVDAGGRCVSLGPNILRTETAAVALAALCLLPGSELKPVPTDLKK